MRNLSDTELERKIEYYKKLEKSSEKDIINLVDEIRLYRTNISSVEATTEKKHVQSCKITEMLNQKLKKEDSIRECRYQLKLLDKEMQHRAIAKIQSFTIISDEELSAKG